MSTCELTCTSDPQCCNFAFLITSIRCMVSCSHAIFQTFLDTSKQIALCSTRFYAFPIFPILSDLTPKHNRYVQRPICTFNWLNRLNSMEFEKSIESFIAMCCFFFIAVSRSETVRLNSLQNKMIHLKAPCHLTLDFLVFIPATVCDRRILNVI